MIPVDFHSHTLFSGCGVHTVNEMLTAAKNKGLQGLAITDHGRLVGGKANSVFFERLREPVPGIRLLKGIEANLDGDSGKTDCPVHFLSFIDIVLVGLHDNLAMGLGKEYYTNALVRVFEQCPYVDIVSHPNNPAFPLDYDKLTDAALEFDVALEMNNSKVRLSRTPDEDTETFIRICKQKKCRVSVSSDAHTVEEIGGDNEIRRLLSKHDFPEELIVNRTAEAAFSFVVGRKARKRPVNG